jgi:hypothetical protein
MNDFKVTVKETKQRAVFDYITRAEAHGATDEEVQKALNMNPHTECPRRIELAQLGLIEKSGTQRYTSSHCKADVWVATGKHYARGFLKEPRPSKKARIVAGKELAGRLRRFDGKWDTTPETGHVLDWLCRGCP